MFTLHIAEYVEKKTTKNKCYICVSTFMCLLVVYIFKLLFIIYRIANSH